MAEQPLFAVQAPAVAGERAVRADHPVAGHDDRDRVAPVGQPDGAGGDRRLTQRGGYLAVADRLAVRDPGELGPHGELERRAARRERQVERGALAREVLTQLRGHRTEPAGTASPA